MSTLPMQQEDHPAYNLVGPTEDHRGEELAAAGDSLPNPFEEVGDKKKPRKPPKTVQPTPVPPNRY